MKRFMNRFYQRRVPSLIFAIAILLTSIATLSTPVSAASSAPLPDHVTIGYWLGGNGGSNHTLREVDPGWDVIIVSFIETVGNYYTPNLNMDLQAVYPGTPDQQAAAFKEDILYLQSLGKKVLISCGGQNGVVHIDNAVQRDIFLNGVIDIISEYNFDGFDVDFEGSSIACMNTDVIGNLVTPQSIHLEYILRELVATFGPDFIITAAPEYCYVQGGALAGGNNGAFLPLLDAIRDILTFIHPQYYNGFNGDFSWLDPSANAGPAFSQVYSEQGYVRLSEMLITGFNTQGKGTFNGLRPDQVAFGVPARTGAGNGAQPVSVYAAALRTLLAEYPSVRGVMTWSIGWDETGSNAFVNAIAPIVAEANGGTLPTPVTNAQTPNITSQPADLSVLVDEDAALSITASVTTGTLSYQWYEASAKTNNGGTAINGATGASYDAPTAAEGTHYYYCVVTNTDTAATGNQTAAAVSKAVSVTVSEEGTVIPDPDPVEGDTWEAGAVYTTGDTVVYLGQTYVCKWWTQGDVPTDGGPWELVNGSNEYVPGVAYVEGDVVVYQGQTWRANWWTQAVPGTDASWTLVD